MNPIAWKLAAGVLLATAVAATAITRAPAPAESDRASNAPSSRGDYTSIPGPDSTLESMAGILDREVEERLRLEEEIEILRMRLESLEQSLEVEPETAREQAPEPRRQEIMARRNRGQVSESDFIEAGFDEEEAAYYRRLYDEQIMAQLYLRDQAQREGWLRSDRFREELNRLPGNLENLRGQLDDETYSRYLYALGRPNQVSIQRVLSGSEAENAGLQQGDVIVSIDETRIFAANDVRRVSMLDNDGGTIAVEVLRDGRRMQAYLPRGPMGISMSSDSVRPSSP